MFERACRAFYARCLLAWMLAVWGASAGAVTIDASDIRGLRDIVGEPDILVLNFQAVKNNKPELEDRTIAHFDISVLGAAPRFAKLSIPVVNLDPGAPGGTFNVFTFAGDGVVSADEWDAGRHYRRFSGLDEPGRLELNVTGLVAAALASGDRFLSFAFRGGAIPASQGYGDRWNLGPESGLPSATVVVPVPPALLMMLTGLALAVSGAARRSWPGSFRRRQVGAGLAAS